MFAKHYTRVYNIVGAIMSSWSLVYTKGRVPPDQFVKGKGASAPSSHIVFRNNHGWVRNWHTFDTSNSFRWFFHKDDGISLSHTYLKLLLRPDRPNVYKKSILKREKSRNLIYWFLQMHG